MRCEGAGALRRGRSCAILENRPIARGVYRLRLGCGSAEGGALCAKGWLGCAAGIAQHPGGEQLAPEPLRAAGGTGGTAGFAAGQFANVMVPGYFLRRPIALCDWDADSFTLIYKLAGAGTRALSALPAGTVLDVLVPLGHGFDWAASSNGKALLVGGGCGVGPLYALAKALKADGQAVAVALGFGSAEDAYLYKELEGVADAVWLATLDGSLGREGLVTAVLEEAAASCGRFYACGPTAMLKAVCAALALPGQVSLEERMACGFGGCVGCAIETRAGMKRVCADGPVFEREVLGW